MVSSRWFLPLGVVCLITIGMSLRPGTAGQVAVGEALRWQVLDTAEVEDGYAGAMLVADWDEDGCEEILVPRWGGPSYDDQAMRERRCDLIELDGSVKATGVLGEQLGTDSIAWDYTGDGRPEIACDSRRRGGLAYDQWFAAKQVELTRKLEQQLAPLRQRQHAIQKELQTLRGGSNAARSAQLKMEDDQLYQQIDELRFSDAYRVTTDDERLARGYFVRNDTSIFTLEGKEIAKLTGRHHRGSQHLTGVFAVSGNQQLILGPAYYSFEVEPMRNGGIHRVYSPGRATPECWQRIAGWNYLTAGDLDGDGLAEIAGQRLGYAPYAWPQAEIVIFNPGAAAEVQVLLRCAADSPGAWPAACVDLNGDKIAEVILACGHVLDPANGGHWQLDRPPFVRPAFLRNDTAPSLVMCELDGLGQPELWAVVERTQLAAFTSQGSLVHYEDLGERILQLATVRDAKGQAYLLVQLESRILLWRVEPQAGPGGAMA